MGCTKHRLVHISIVKHLLTKKNKILTNQNHVLTGRCTKKDSIHRHLHKSQKNTRLVELNLLAVICIILTSILTLSHNKIFALPRNRFGCSIKYSCIHKSNMAKLVCFLNHSICDFMAWVINQAAFTFLKKKVGRKFLLGVLGKDTIRNC